MPAYTHLEDDYTSLRLSARIRDERKQRGWTLAQLASKLSLSVGTMSALENQKLPVTVDLLVTLARVFDVPIDALLPKSTSQHFHITRRGHTDSEPSLPMKVVNRATESLVSYHNRVWPLARPFIGKQIEPLEIDVQPIADRELRFISHNHEEFVFVLRGRIQCLMKTPDGLTDATLSAGDCIYFWSYLPHCIRALDGEPARSVHIEYSPGEDVEAEYSNGGTGQTIYLVDAGQENLTVQIAGKIVALRKARGLSAAQFADELGISIRRLKQIEGAAKSISIDFLLRVCRIFQKPKEYFLSMPPVRRPFSHILRARDIRRASSQRTPSNRHCVTPALALPLADGFPSHGMHPFLMRLDRRDDAPALVQHPGQEFVYVLRGAVRFATRGEGDELIEETLLPGDACLIDASVPHSFRETSYTPYEPAGAEMLLISTTPDAPAPGGNGSARAPESVAADRRTRRRGTKTE